MSITTLILFLGLAPYGNFSEAKVKGPLQLNIIPSQTKYDDPSLDITLTGKATTNQDFQTLNVDWVLPQEIEVVQGNISSVFENVKSGTTVSSEIVVRFKSTQWKVILSVYELKDGAKVGSTQILTPPDSELGKAQPVKAGLSTKSQAPYSLKGVKVIH